LSEICERTSNKITRWPLHITTPRSSTTNSHTTYLDVTFNGLRRTPLKKGEITAQGLNLLDGTSLPPAHLEVPNRFALTGGTDAYAKTRGEVIELYDDIIQPILSID